MPDETPSSPLKPTAEWHSRGYVPHWEAGEEPQAVTFRLAASLPVKLRMQWQAELSHLPKEQWPDEERKLIERALDAGHGEAVLARAEIAALVENALLFFDGERYRQHAWVIMPTHVHVLSTPVVSSSLSSIVHSWKSFTAKAINQQLGRTGKVWFEEYYDRKIRSERHFEAVRFYIEQNPVKANLCVEAEDRRFSSASRG
ncbi:hypothetical protein BA190_27985 [Labrys sp. WJW]|uniref:transposase n=1 Tax=Labrys sp. WJW TaxID=1737983 RepID=UPI000833C9C6|nr:transposase [Labrys sp. WJW]OCC01619.1 hypothetical protein BA190_27985 [Labrys sp. WJW]